jgi:mono/diheme cytochrome c family protein/rhodanese-related sulfurtransferase
VSRLVVLCLLVAACGRGSATPQAGKRDAGVRDANLGKLAGPTLYQHLCAPCHGADAKGYKADHAPSLVTSTFLESASDEFLRRSIVFGRPGTSMAAYGKEAGGPLDPDAVGKLVAWLRQQGPAARELPPAGTGDLTRGSAIYQHDCAKCHGSRTARGEGVFLANARFLEAASDAYLKWAIVHGRPGTPMEPWGSGLSDQDVDDLVTYVRAFAAPPVVQMLPEPTGKEPLVIHSQGKDPEFAVRTDPERSYVTVDQVAKALADGRKMIIIDARPESEWRRVHVTGAVSMPYHDLTKLDRIPKNGTWILTYCACPHHLSGIVADELVKRGYKHVAVLDEGINAWHRRGYPVVAAPGVEPPPQEGPQ